MNPKNVIKNIILIVFISASSIIAQVGNMEVTSYPGGNTSGFSFSFDDGLMSQFTYASKILDQKGFKGTYYVLPPFLTDSLPTIWRYGTWQQFTDLDLRGHEIASHTLTHPHLTQLNPGDTLTEGTIIYELYHSKKDIENRIPGKECISFAYPFAEHAPLVDSLTSLFYENGRDEGLTANFSSLFFSEWYGINSKPVRFSEPRNSVDDDLDELYDFMDWTENFVQNGEWGILMIHEVVPFDSLANLISQGSYEPMTTEWLADYTYWLKDFADENNVAVETVGNITKYFKERDAFNYQVVSVLQDSIFIFVEDQLDNFIFDFPLTAEIEVPGHWDFAITIQNNFSDTTQVIKSGGSSFAQLNFLPDEDTLMIIKSNLTSFGEEELTAPEDFVLYQNYPNPFNPSTKIRYTIPAVLTRDRVSVQIKVYDILGNEVATLVDEYKPAGTYEVEFSASGIRNLPAGRQGLPSGIYFYTLTAGDHIQSRKMLLLK